MLLLHGSATGTATDVATSLYRLARRYRIHDLQLRALEDVSLIDLLEADIAIFVVSTTGNGDIPASMHGFWSSMLRNDLEENLLEDLNFVLIGLGDSKYAQFNWTAKKLRRRLTQLGGNETMKMVMCDESAHEGLDTALIPFISSFEGFLKQLNGGLEPIPKEIVLPPVCPIRLIDNRFPQIDSLSLRDKLSRVSAGLTQNKRLTEPNHFQDVRLLTFVVKTDNTQTINPGDVLSLYPANPDVSVERFLILLGWETLAEEVISVNPGSKASDLFCNETTTLRQFVKKAIPLHGIPALSFFSRLRQFTTDENFIEKFDEWETTEGKDDLYDYLTRPRRTLLEVIDDFSNGIKVPVEHCIDLFGLTVSRSYSIAGARPLNSPEQGNETAQFEVELLVAMVNYQTKIKEPRQGLASRYLADLKPCASNVTAQLMVSLDKPIIEENKLPSPSNTTPLLLVCTGTGLAPLRFFINRLQRKQGKIAKLYDITLFFGCRSHDDDLVMSSMSEELRRTITIKNAYSRLPGTPRTYVQDLVVHHADLVRDILAGNGQVYLCGSSGAMPDAVCRAIDTINPDTTEHLRESGRWWQETW